MAERRMFAKTIITSDAFLDMPATARCLYFTLAMFADDDGFVNNPRGIMRQCGSSDDDMKILIVKRFVLLFENGVIVIKHWRIHNYIQKDRYHETKYIDEKNSLILNKDGSYSMDTQCIQDVSKVDTEVRLGKSSIDKNIKNISSSPDEGECQVIPQNEVWFGEFWGKYPRKVGKIEAQRAFKKKCKSAEDLKEILDGIERWLPAWKDPQYIPYPSKWLNNERYLETPAVTQEANKDPYSFLPFHD